MPVGYVRSLRSPYAQFTLNSLLPITAAMGRPCAGQSWHDSEHLGQNRWHECFELCHGLSVQPA